MLVDDSERRNELVGNFVVVEFADTGQRIGIGSSLRRAGDHRVEGLTLLLPAQVSVHRKVASGDRGDLADTDLTNLLFQCLEIPDTARRHGVAAIHKSMDVDAGELVLGSQTQKRVEMAQLRVDAAVRD